MDNKAIKAELEKRLKIDREICKEYKKFIRYYAEEENININEIIDLCGRVQYMYEIIYTLEDILKKIKEN